MKGFIISILAALGAIASPAPGPKTAAVGPQHLPETIAPIEAPFPMPEFKRPSFEDRSIRVKMRKKGLSTDRIQEAIDKIAALGGGTVIIPEGEWLTGRITLRSNVELRLEEGAVLKFSGRIKDYLPVVFTRDEGIELYSLGACIYAFGENNIALTGKGKIVGPDTSCEIFTRNSEKLYNIEKDAAPLPLEKRVFDGADGGGVFLPKTFAPINCTNVLIEGVTLERGLYWNVVPQYCDTVIIRGVSVWSHGHGRTDGIDIDSSSNVLIEYCSLDCQDDCYTMKSGRGDDGLRVARKTENVVIRNSLALRGAGGIVCGTEIAGGVKNVYMHDCVFDGTQQAFRFKSLRTRGGGIENIYVERVRATLTHSALYCDLLNSVKWAGEYAYRYPAREITKYTPEFKNISIHDVEILGCEKLVEVHTIPERPVRSLFFGNVEAKCRTIGSVQDALDFSMKDVVVESEDSVLTIDGCDYASFFGLRNQSSGKSIRIVQKGVNRYLNIQEYPSGPVTYNSIHPGQVWLDTEGKPIQAHAPQISYNPDTRTWYWYGEDKTRALLGTNYMFGGVHCYSSKDLYNWKDEGLIIAPDSLDHLSPIHYSQKLERPHIIYCCKTGKWVCWAKSQATDGYFAILQADSFTGPYTFVRNLRPEGYGVGDHDLYVDESSGKAYVWFERPHWEIICAELTEDYLDVSPVFSRHFSGVVPPLCREAPAHFEFNGKHYVYTSGTTGYTPNPSEVAVFEDYHGEYRVLGDPHQGDEFAHSFCSQISGVIRIPGSDLFIVLADRWDPQTFRTDIPSKTAAAKKNSYLNHRPNPEDYSTPAVQDRRYSLIGPTHDVYNATYVFLPVIWKDGVPSIEWFDEWRVEDFL